MNELPIFTDVTLSVEEITSLLSCIQVTTENNRKIIEDSFNVKLEGVKTKLSEAIKGSIDFYDKHIEPLSEQNVNRSQ